MQKYFQNFVESLAQRAVRLVLIRAVEIVEAAERQYRAPLTVERAVLPEVEYIEN